MKISQFDEEISLLFLYPNPGFWCAQRMYHLMHLFSSFHNIIFCIHTLGFGRDQLIKVIDSEMAKKPRPDTYILLSSNSRVMLLAPYHHEIDCCSIKIIPFSKTKKQHGNNTKQSRVPPTTQTLASNCLLKHYDPTATIISIFS